MSKKKTRSTTVVPNSLGDSLSLIEKAWPTSRISAETQKERKAGSGQTLTGLGSYWRGRKPLILSRACILASILPATDDLKKDVEIFEKLMGIADESLGHRFQGGPTKFVKLFPKYAEKVASFGEIMWKCDKANCFNRKKVAKKIIHEIEKLNLPSKFLKQLKEFIDNKNLLHPNGVAQQFRAEFPKFADVFTEIEKGSIRWRSDISISKRKLEIAKAFADLPYHERLKHLSRSEEIAESDLHSTVWTEVNKHLGTNANSITELVEQLGIMRFGRRPKVADVFSGSGSIPFEASRIGCDTIASDLNPIACMLSWGAFNVVGSKTDEFEEMKKDLFVMLAKIDKDICELGIEHDEEKNRARIFFYCLETKCPRTDFMVPLSTTWVISLNRNTIVKLEADVKQKKYNFRIETDNESENLKLDYVGNVKNDRLYHSELKDEVGVSLKEIRGDFEDQSGMKGNKLRQWEKFDFFPRTDDIWQERLYAIQWIDQDDLRSGKANPRTWFACPTENDLAREAKVKKIVESHVEEWFEMGYIPSTIIEAGENTNQPILSRGWTHWHHLFNSRHLLLNAIANKFTQDSPVGRIVFANLLNNNSKLCYWQTNRDALSPTFYNQALNPVYNYCARGYSSISRIFNLSKNIDLPGPKIIVNKPASEFDNSVDIFVSDPPYADAIRYEEITEFFIAWLKTKPPKNFENWIWDSRRAISIKGHGQEFRNSMIEAFENLNLNLSENGIQIVQFVHRDAKTWSDMAYIFWGAGMRVVQNWYIATESESGIRKGGYVQGTHNIIIRKRKATKSGYKDDIVREIRNAVKYQIDEMINLNDEYKKDSRSENFYSEVDLHIAGYATALRVLTNYSEIDGKNMIQESIRVRVSDERSVVDDLTEFGAQVASEFLVPTGIERSDWFKLNGYERFYVKMLELESRGKVTLAEFQNFAKAFKVNDHEDFMASNSANNSRLKHAFELGNSFMNTDSEFGTSSVVRLSLRAIWRKGKDEVEDIIEEMRDLYGSEFSNYRSLIISVLDFIAEKRTGNNSKEASNARILSTAMKQERL